MSKAPKVVGFKELSFWQEDGIGVITVLTDNEGNVTPNFFQEFLKVISIAITDDKVKTVAITGSNESYFLNEFRKNDELGEMELLQLCSTTLKFLGTMEKPIFTLANAKCKDLGLELALLSDVILASESAEFLISNDYLPKMGLSKTISRFSSFKFGKAEEGRNCDRVFEQEKFLDISNDFILSNLNLYMPMVRRNRLGDLENLINYEHSSYMRKRNTFQ